jgi:glyoxylase-like metal-dependent hydrolase (beta-lactamase superfamily II)
VGDAGLALPRRSLSEDGRVMLIPAGNASEWTGPGGNNTYLLAPAPSVLVDAGVGNPQHLAAVERELEQAALDLVLITHHHIDHVAGAPELARRWPEVSIRGGGIGEPFSDGEVVTAGGTRLRAIHTPGHAPDHFCFFDESSGDLFCGDLARVGGTIVIPASRGGSLRQYLESLRRVRDLHPARLLPAHGPPIDDPTALLDGYIAHRNERERQILEALAAGCVTPEQIVRRVYPGLSPTLTAAAEETVRAHLQKIADD